MSEQNEVIASHIDGLWSDIVNQLTDYVKIPALSPAFDSQWKAAGHIDSAVDLVVNWLRSRPVEGMSVWVQEIEGLTPLVIVEIDPFQCSDEATTVLYGHLDKQPPMEGWREGLGPWTPVIEDDRLFGRGGADDGYAAFCSLAAVEAIQAAGGSHGRCLLLIEASEESGSPDLPAHLIQLAGRVGDVRLVVCLDSGCANYDTLWLSTSLRGLLSCNLKVSVVSEGLHSGGASGIVPSSFRIMRMLLDRIESAKTGEVLLRSAHVDIPPVRVDQASGQAAQLEGFFDPLPLLDGVQPMQTDAKEAILNRTWRPTLSYIGADGLPPTGNAGNVLRPYTTLNLSLRLPPTADAAAVTSELVEVLTTEPPYGAVVEVSDIEAADGWHAPPLSEGLEGALQRASKRAFGQSMEFHGEGGSIPFLGMLADQFPAAQFAVMGVLGPGSNAHGPNEFLHLSYAQRLTTCLAQVLNGYLPSA